MNCNELHKDIAELKASCATLQEGYNRMNNELSGKADFRNNYHKTEQLSDKTLEKYLSDFTEKNPELFSWKLDKKLEYFKGLFGKQIEGATITKRTSNGNIIVLSDSPYPGDNCMFYEYSLDDFDNLVLKRSSFEIKDKRVLVQTVFTPLPDGAVLVGGANILYEIKEDDRSKTHLSDYKSEIFVDKPRAISAVAPLPNGGILIGGEDGEICEGRKNPHTKRWEIVKSLEREEYSPPVTCITEMPDGAMLVACEKYIYECRENDEGDWELGEGINGFVTHDGYEDEVKSIFQLSDEKMLIIGCKDAIYEYNKNSEGDWEIGEKRIGPPNINPYFVTQLPNNEVIILGEGQTFVYKKNRNGWTLIEDETISDAFEKECDEWPDYIIPLESNKIVVGGVKWKEIEDGYPESEDTVMLFSQPEQTVEGLKQHLDIIIEKGDSNELQ
ncbi:hypothetical protein IKD67_00210 [Candidatus Saccharibacteria bacterium]|nr:hypothetical protein [Candidatus Saccharibacteria bacterium]